MRFQLILQTEEISVTTHKKHSCFTCIVKVLTQVSIFSVNCTWTHQHEVKSYHASIYCCLLALCPAILTINSYSTVGGDVGDEQQVRESPGPHKSALGVYALVAVQSLQPPRSILAVVCIHGLHLLHYPRNHNRVGLHPVQVANHFHKLRFRQLEAEHLLVPFLVVLLAHRRDYQSSIRSLSSFWDPVALLLPCLPPTRCLVCLAALRHLPLFLEERLAGCLSQRLAVEDELRQILHFGIAREQRKQRARARVVVAGSGEEVLVQRLQNVSARGSLCGGRLRNQKRTPDMLGDFFERPKVPFPLRGLRVVRPRPLRRRAGRPRPLRRRDWIDVQIPPRARSLCRPLPVTALVLAALRAGSRQRRSAGSRRAPGPHATPGLWGLLRTHPRGHRAGAPAASVLLRRARPLAA